MESQSDSSIMRLVQEGDTAQMAVLFERHHMALFRYLFALSRNREASEDLVQEAFLRALKHARSYDLQQSFGAWLHSIARNAYFDLLRKKKNETPIESMANVIKSSEPVPDEAARQRQDTAFLEKAFAQLSEDKREVLVLSRYESLRYDEIARILECEVGAVKGRVFRALKELRERFCELRGDRVYGS